MIGGSRIPIKDWPTRKLVGFGSVLVLITTSGTFLALRVAWAAWKQGATGVALGAFAAAIFMGSWVVVIWEMGTALWQRRRSRRGHESPPSRVETNAAEVKDPPALGYGGQGKAESKQP